MSIVAVGAVAYDTIETPHGTVTGALGGSLSYFALGARFFGPVSIVAAVGEDFREEDRRLFLERGIDTRALVLRPGKTFHWHGRYHEDMNIRDSLVTQLGVFGDFMPELLPDHLSGIKRISRRAMSAPSSGSSKVHAVEQQEIIDEAFAES